MPTGESDHHAVLDIDVRNHTGEQVVGSYSLLAVAERLATDLQVDS